MNELMNDRGVCRAAPGFDQVCYLVVITYKNMVKPIMLEYRLNTIAAKECGFWFGLSSIFRQPWTESLKPMNLIMSIHLMKL